VSMESFSKNHVETGNFMNGFCIKMVSYWLHMDCVVMAHLKYLSLDIFLDILTILIGFHVWAWNHLAKTM
jgi:hypothetical protein